jgi:hypothetical protein
MAALRTLNVPDIARVNSVLSSRKTAFPVDAHILNPHGGVLGKADLEDRRGALLHHRERVGVVGVDQHHAVARDDPHQVRERFLDRRQVVENIGVVELEIVDDDQLGQVMEELAPLVEKGRVVLVALENPVRAPPAGCSLGADFAAARR